MKVKALGFQDRNEERKKRKATQAAKSSSHQLRKRGHLGRKKGTDPIPVGGS